MVLLDSDRITRVPPYSGTALAVPAFEYETITLFGHSFQSVLLAFPVRYKQPHNPKEINLSGLGYTDFARRYFRYLN